LLAIVSLYGCSKSSGDAEIRVLNTSIDYSSLDLYLNSSDNSSSNKKEISGAAYGTLTSYLGVGSGSYTVQITNSGVTSALYSTDEKLSKGTYRTYVAYGNSGKFGVLEIAENQDAPDSTYTKVELVDAAPDAGSIDVYLTDPSVALSDASPTFSSVSGGTIASAGFTTISSGTYRLRVTAAGNQSDLRLDSVTGITFSSKEILSIVVTGTAGGVLVNASVIPQQETATAINTTYSRVRAAAGIPSGSNTTVAMDGTVLLNAAAANTVSQYSLVTAGSQALTLKLNGTAVTASDQTLTAGSDYTVLVLNGTAVSGTTVSLITDDNRLPSTSGDASIKLVNAMSSLGDPVTMNVNYTPVASAIDLGAGSTATQVTAGSNTEIDTDDATTSTSLFSNTSATLTTGEVYTLFMFGSSTTPVGALRTNR
jgi:hypothetical protein